MDSRGHAAFAEFTLDAIAPFKGSVQAFNGPSDIAWRVEVQP